MEVPVATAVAFSGEPLNRVVLCEGVMGSSKVNLAAYDLLLFRSLASAAHSPVFLFLFLSSFVFLFHARTISSFLELGTLSRRFIGT